MYKCFFIAFLILFSAHLAMAQKESEKGSSTTPTANTTTPSTSTTNIINLGPSINSSFSELAPIISPDGRTLYIVRDGHPDNIAGNSTQDIWYSTLNEQTGAWNTAIHNTRPLNDQRSNGVQSVTPDGNTLLVRGAYNNGEYEGRGLSFVQRTTQGWSAPQKLKIAGYAKMALGKYSSSYLTNDGKVLLMGFSEVSGGESGDLYVSFLEDDNSWSRPISLGKINTDYIEDIPFLAADGVTLYFGSERPGGQGSLDIWKTTRLDDTWTSWSEPENLGSGINTTEFDAYYSIAASGDYAFMTTYKNTLGKADIVRIKLEEKNRPKPVVLVRGRVLNGKTNEPISADIFYELLPEGKQAGIAKSNPSDGTYSIVLPYGFNYGFLADKPGFISVSDNIDLSTQAAYREITKDLVLMPIEKGAIVRLNNLFFETNKSVLQPESMPELERIINAMKQNPAMKVQVSGHTDNIGNEAANLKLSLNRAQSVFDYLTLQGISSDRIAFKGYGKTQPKADNATVEGRSSNRRVEFMIMSN